MAALPVEILNADAVQERILKRAVDIANSSQSELNFQFCTERLLLDILAFAPRDKLSTVSFFDQLDVARTNSRGFHPFLVSFTSAMLFGRKLSNLFGSTRGYSGLAIVTFNQVDSLIASDDDAMTGYALYYLARYAMGFISPAVKNHAESRQCIYDRKVNKLEIINSFRSGAICDRCRTEIWTSGKGSKAQMDAVDRLIEHASSLVHKTKISRRPNVFIGSSTKNIAHANAIKELLGAEFVAQVWNEDHVFRLGTATIEQLEEHVRYYDFGIFVMLPDDRLTRGNIDAMVPRDNVVFEAGLFTGKLSRARALIVSGIGSQVVLPTDLNGLTTLPVDFNAALPDSLRDAVRKAAEHMTRVFGEGK